jgi:hypothetical protein
LAVYLCLCALAGEREFGGVGVGVGACGH